MYLGNHRTSNKNKNVAGDKNPTAHVAEKPIVYGNNVFYLKKKCKSCVFNFPPSGSNEASSSKCYLKKNDCLNSISINE